MQASLVSTSHPASGLKGVDSNADYDPGHLQSLGAMTFDALRRNCKGEGTGGGQDYGKGKGKGEAKGKDKGNDGKKKGKGKDGKKNRKGGAQCF